MSVALRPAQLLVLDHSFATRELTMDSAKLVANPRPGRHLADVGQQLLAKTVEPDGRKIISVANGPRFCAPEDFGPGGLSARDGPRDDDEATDRRFAFSNDAWSMEPDVFANSCADVCAFLSFGFRPLILGFPVVGSFECGRVDGRFKRRIVQAWVTFSNYIRPEATRPLRAKCTTWLTPKLLRWT